MLITDQSDAKHHERESNQYLSKHMYLSTSILALQVYNDRTVHDSMVNRTHQLSIIQVWYIYITIFGEVVCPSGHQLKLEQYRED